MAVSMFKHVSFNQLYRFLLGKAQAFVGDWKRWLSLALAGWLGLLVFVSRYGVEALNPLFTRWLAEEDAGQHQIAWLFFRNEPWRFPLGALQGYTHPLGTTLGFMDAIPWVAVVLKVFSPLLPVDFQYMGPWLALCFVLQGIVAAWLVRRLGGSDVQQLLAAALLILAPPLLVRSSMGHEALSAHWLLVLCLGLNILPMPNPSTALRYLWLALTACLLSAGIHPVIWMCVFVLTLALCLRLAWRRYLPFATCGVGVAGAVLVSLASLGLLGYIGHGTPVGGNGFGHYSADFATFLNPLVSEGKNLSRLLPPLSRGDGQYEGYAYLGLGGLLLVVVALWAVVKRRERSQHILDRLPVLVVCGLMFLFSLSSNVTVLGETFANLDGFYRPFAKLVEPFRSSGRFAWPLAYLCTILGVALLVTARTAWATAMLVAVLTLQVADVDLGHGRMFYREGNWKRLVNARWRKAAEGKRHMVLYPPTLNDSARGGCPDPAFHDHLQWAYLAYRTGLTFNSGYVARLDVDKALRYCDGLTQDVREERFDNDTLYVVAMTSASLFRTPVLRCDPFDGVLACRVRQP